MPSTREPDDEAIVRRWLDRVHALDAAHARGDIGWFTYASTLDDINAELTAGISAEDA